MARKRETRPRRWPVAAALLGLLSGTAPAAATTWYVRANGNDDHDGLTPATALASVRPAARRLREPGDRLIVGPGTYREGNISPFGNGTAEAPMVLFGDASGASTGDPPGPVRIVPPNTPRADSGFLIRGRTDVVIEGFEISGARDAGIDVRGRWRTGAASTRIALRHNRVRGGRIAIRLDAEGEIEITGNHLLAAEPPTTGAGDGIVVRGGSGHMQLRLVDNVIDGRFIGINGGFIGMDGGGMLDAVLEGNELRTQARNLQFGADRLWLVGNRLHGPVRGGEVVARELIATDNRVDARIAFGASEVLDLQRNTIHPHAGIRRWPASARIVENAITELSIGGAGELALHDNEGQTLRGQRITSAVASGNRFTALMQLWTDAAVDVTDNEAGALAVRGGRATVRANAVGQRARVFADEAAVTENTVGTLAVQSRRHPRAAPPASGETLVVRDNTVAGALASGGAAAVIVAGNTVNGPVKASAYERIEVVDNDARGIACLARSTGTTVMLRDNRSRHAAGPGLAVIGASSATVAGNVAADNTGAGLVVRRVARLEVTGNTLRANREGGASVRVPPVGDCNENNDVTIAELLLAVGVALQHTARHLCDAADANRDRLVTVDEVVLGVGAALGWPDPLISTVALRDNVVEDNQRRGLDIYARAAIEATGNRVLRNGGIPLAVRGRLPRSEALIAGNVLGGGGAEGLLIAAVERSLVHDNVIFDNRDAGILLRAAPRASVTNNLVYANGRAGIIARLGVDPSDVTEITRNTFFANGRGGVVLGQAFVTSTGTAVRHNIINQNNGGILLAKRAAVRLTVERNLNSDGYGEGVPPGETDIDSDPLFVDPDGADGILGGDAWADDDFRLQPESPAIDGIGFRYPDR